MNRLRLGEHALILLPVIRGLVSEGARVETQMRSLQPSMVMLSVSPEELYALRHWEGEECSHASSEEEIYAEGLKEFGAVAKPPPAFLQAVRLSKTLGYTVKALDMPEEEFTEMYCAVVSSLDLLRMSLRRSRLARARFDLSSPDAFVLDLDRRIHRVRGLRRVDEERERYMAARCKELISDVPLGLALVELERAEGVMAHLFKMGFERE
ncbi:MAG: hypothetical protein AB1665_07820 [Candidatus Thermoplasmatota archaeon]